MLAPLDPSCLRFASINSSKEGVWRLHSPGRVHDECDHGIFLLSNNAVWDRAGIALSHVYTEDSPTALIVVGLLNYMALVDLLASDFMGTKLQGSAKLQVWAYMAVLLGAGGMSVRPYGHRANPMYGNYQ